MGLFDDTAIVLEVELETDSVCNFNSIVFSVVGSSVVVLEVVASVTDFDWSSGSWPFSWLTESGASSEALVSST